MNHYILEANNITKKYNSKIILNDISLSLKKGESISLIGANGCGKSTLLRILSEIASPDSGIVKITPGQKIAFVPDHFEKINLSINKFLKYHLALNYQHNTLEEYYEIFQLLPMINTPMKYLSKGSLQKVAVIQALMNPVDLLFMDEPLSGQDMMSKVNFIRKILEMKASGMSIVMACHEKELIEEIADTILLVEDGKLYDGQKYLYDTNKNISLFLLDTTKLQQKKLQHKKNILSFHSIGKKTRITTNITNSIEIMKYCIEQNIHIMKYEEVEKK